MLQALNLQKLILYYMICLNVVLTPHIAGSAGNEQARLGSFMVEELERFVKGEELKYSVSQEQFKRMA